MKKLMTMIGALAMSFGLFAETQFSSVDFSQSCWEGKTFSPLMTDAGEEAAPESSVTRYWSYTDAAFASELTLNEGLLEVRTGSKVLSRNFSGLPSTDPIDATAAAVTAGEDGLFADMTFNLAGQVLTDAPTADGLTGAKFAFFAFSNEDLVEEGAETNLWAIGGYVKDNGTIGKRAFKLALEGSEINENFLAVNHRVTFKAYSTITAVENYPGFLILIDGKKFCKVVAYADFTEAGAIDFENIVTPGEEATTWNYLGADFTAAPSVAFRYTARNLFLSLQCGATASSKFTSIDFKGNANLKKLALNATVPEDLTEPFTDAQTLTITKGAGIDSINVTGATATGTDDAYTFAPGASVTVTATYLTGYEYKAGKWTLNGTAVDGSSGYTWTPADNDALAVAGFKAVATAYDASGAVIGSFETIAEAIAAPGVAKVGLTADVTLDEALAINSTITLDLAGQTLSNAEEGHWDSVIANSGALTIIDSSVQGTGKIAPTERVVAVLNESGSTLTIEAGTYDGDVVAAEECAVKPVITATAGAFKQSDAMTKDAVEAFIDTETYRVAGEEVDDYWTVELIPAPTTFTVTVEAPVEHSTVQVTVNDIEVGTTGGVYTVEAGADVHVAYCLDVLAGYKFVEGATDSYDFDDIDDNEETKAPAVEAIEYAITVTGGTATPAKYTVAGATVTLEWTPVTGKKFVSWTVSPDTGCTIAGDTLTIAQGTTGAITVTAVTADLIDLSTAVITLSADEVFEGDQMPTFVKATLNDKDLTKADFTLTEPTAEIVEGAELTWTITGTGDYMGTASKSITVQKKATPTRPSAVDGGSQAQKDAYDAWAKKQTDAGKTVDPAASHTLNCFILGEDVDTMEAALETKLAAEITDAMLKDLVAEGTVYTGDFTIPAKYPNATFKFEVTEEIPSVEGVSKFWRLKAYFKPANAID